MRRFLFYFLTLSLAFWLQTVSNHFLGGSWFSVNLILVMVLYFGLTHGPITGQGLGFLWGLLTDASSLGLMGVHTLLFAAAGYAAGMLRRQLDETKMWTQTIFSFGISWLYWLLYIGLDRLFAAGDRPLPWRTAVEPLTNAIVAPLIFWALEQWWTVWDLDRMEK